MQNDDLPRRRNGLVYMGKTDAQLFEERCAKADQYMAEFFPEGQSPAKKKSVKREPAEPVIRETLSFPQEDHELIRKLRKRAAVEFEGMYNRSEIVRAALRVAAGLSPEELRDALENIKRLKRGRR